MNILNTIVNNKTFNINGEVMLDVILSQKAADGKSMLIIDRIVYRYKKFIDEYGQEGILLFAISDRYYGKDIDVFFANFKSNEYDLISEVANFEIPQVLIAK